MRPLIHPAPDAITVEGVLHALADPVRAAIFMQIAASECSQTCSKFIHLTERGIPKSTLSQHFKVLRESGLIRSVRHGVEMQNTSRCEELEKRFPGLVRSIVSAHQVQAGGKRKAAARAA
jgi:DNA-binding transcriptional ArsR family regulator